MKKIFLTITLAILTSGISVTAFAKTTNKYNKIISTVVASSFKEIALKALPQAVKKAVVKDFSAAFVAKAYVNANGQYKMALTIDDENKIVVYADKDGNWLKEGDVK